MLALLSRSQTNESGSLNRHGKTGMRPTTSCRDKRRNDEVCDRTMPQIARPMKNRQRETGSEESYNGSKQATNSPQARYIQKKRREVPLKVCDTHNRWWCEPKVAVAAVVTPGQ